MQKSSPIIVQGYLNHQPVTFLDRAAFKSISRRLTYIVHCYVEVMTQIFEKLADRLIAELYSYTMGKSQHHKLMIQIAN
jgi:hypothetical protein